jgi:hypothetical protein
LLIIHNTANQQVGQFVTACRGKVVVGIVSLEESLQAASLFHPRAESQKFSLGLVKSRRIERFYLGLTLAIGHATWRRLIGIEPTGGPADTRRREASTATLRRTDHITTSSRRWDYPTGRIEPSAGRYASSGGCTDTGRHAKTGGYANTRRYTDTGGCADARWCTDTRRHANTRRYADPTRRTHR